VYSEIEQAAAMIAEADGLLICAGSGMGMDSGLPDFRGEEGLWEEYPALESAGISFQKIANPNAFRADPSQAWGFYGHRLKLYRETMPHEGFNILRNIAAQLPNGAQVLTSNVDGQFQKAGFSAHQVCEIHGSIHFLQCMGMCDGNIWPATTFKPEVDARQCRLINPMPRCPVCGGIARPNILMFSDSSWLSHRSADRRYSLDSWFNSVPKLVTVEIGAGSSIPSVRNYALRQSGALIRINTSEPEIPSYKEGVSLRMGGLDALQQIWAVLKK
jgi:NAD-dependent SIR2 family protein deacetylase